MAPRSRLMSSCCVTGTKTVFTCSASASNRLQLPNCKNVRVSLSTLERVPLVPASDAVNGTAAHAPGEGTMDGDGGMLGDVDGSGVAGVLPVHEAVPLRVGVKDGVLLREAGPTGEADRVGVTGLLGVSDEDSVTPPAPGAV